LQGYNLFTNIKTGNGKWVLAGTVVKIAGKGVAINAVRTVFGAKSSKNDVIIYQSQEITPDQTAFLSGTNSANIRSTEGTTPAQGDVTIIS
jgi:hypothetical protein